MFENDPLAQEIAEYLKRTEEGFAQALEKYGVYLDVDHENMGYTTTAPGIRIFTGRNLCRIVPPIIATGLIVNFDRRQFSTFYEREYRLDVPYITHSALAIERPTRAALLNDQTYGQITGTGFCTILDYLDQEMNYYQTTSRPSEINIDADISYHIRLIQKNAPQSDYGKLLFEVFRALEVF